MEASEPIIIVIPGKDDGYNQYEDLPEGEEDDEWPFDNEDEAAAEDGNWEGEFDEDEEPF